MASKGKDKIKLKRDEIRFQDKRIDAKRFAYDVIKYTTVKFGLPEDCISVWEGSDNDYGCDDFCSVVSREIIRFQITNRCQYLAYFDKRYKLNQLKSFDLIGRLLQDLMYEEMAGPLKEILDKVEISLSVLGELVLYLYTKDIDLYLKQLIDHWFDCHLNIKKKSFEAAGGLTKLYAINSKPKLGRYDHFHDIFIKNFCLPYKDTASNPNLKEMYNKSYGSRIQKNAVPLPPKGSKDVKKELMRGGEIVMRQSERNGYKLAFEIEKEAVPEPPEPGETAEINSDEDSRVKLPENTLFGIPEHHELYGVDGPLGAVAPPSQELPEANPEELQYGRTLSTKEKMLLRKASFRPSLDQGLVILEHHELYAVGDPSGAVVPPPQDLPEANPEVLPRHGRRLSAREKMHMRNAGARPSLEESLGQLSLNSSKPKTSTKKRAT